MKIRVKLEDRNGGKGRYAYATTEDPTSSYGQPVILLDGIPCGPGDIPDMTIVTADKDLAATLTRLGYQVRISNPQAKWQRENQRPVTTILNAADHVAYEDYCNARGTTPYADLKAYIERCIRPENI